MGASNLLVQIYHPLVVAKTYQIWSETLLDFPGLTQNRNHIQTFEIKGLQIWPIFCLEADKIASNAKNDLVRLFAWTEENSTSHQIMSK